MAANERTKKTTSSVGGFGGRMLPKDEEEKVWDFNAWDNAEWDEEQETYAREVVEKQQQNKPLPEEIAKYNNDPAGFWETFYTKNGDKFFKDRNWLQVEFPDVFENIPSGKCNIFEIGCGAGNTLFPLMKQVNRSDVYYYACDYAPSAVELVKNNPAYDASACRAFVWDVSSPTLPPDMEPGTIDVITSIFVLSALHPDTWSQYISNIKMLLKPGGLLLFRDYGRHDLTQLRFKGNRVLGENFYARGDGTRVYFFTNEELAELFSDFTIEQNGIDRRLLVNRAKKLKMYRVWLQGKFRKEIN
ncbi:S-adenosyl-L-methionine-dependent methyltransferase [Cladochytrium replicatum]|nr:S-adenosyl-L-methionine-dependent methyltransferase [Cladochytrium replicatum]